MAPKYIKQILIDLKGEISGKIVTRTSIAYFQQWADHISRKINKETLGCTFRHLQEVV